MGRGNQWRSWIHIDDTVRCFEMLLGNGQVKGVFNLTAPHSVTQGPFASALGRQLKRPALMPLPEFVVKLMMDDFSEE
jgi:NAD dependent epimerase/dehydratase family enzyme